MLTIKPFDRIVFVGDSLSSTQHGGPWYPGVVADITGRYTASFRTWGRPRGRLASGSVNRGQPTVTNSGVSGDKAGEIVVSSRITQHNPTVVIVEVGINDATGATADATFLVNYRAILDGVLAWGPSTRILCMGLLCNGEAWADGPTWSNATDAQIAAKDGIVCEEAARVGAAYVHLRSPLLALEVSLNPARATSGVFTADGIHPNAAGQAFMCSQALAQIEVRDS